MGLGVELELDPGAAVRDDLGHVRRLGRVGLEEHARAAVELTDDDPLGPVDHERTAIGEHGDLTEVDLLLLDVADRLYAGFLVDIPRDQPHLDLHRSGKSHAPLVAFLDIVFRRTERVVNILQGTGFTKIPDREYRSEDPFNADVLASGRRQIRLQETLVGILLDINQVRDIDNPLDFLKVFPKKLVIRNRISHGVSSCLTKYNSQGHSGRPWLGRDYPGRATI